jgi:hypothetical protein
MKKKRKRKRTGIKLFCVSFLVCCCAFETAASAVAQSRGGNQSGAGATRTIEGRVLNNQGVGVPGAVVLLKDNKTLQVRSYIAQEDGAYHFFGLSTEVNYTLRAEKQDITSKQKLVSVFDSHPDVKLNLKLTRKIKPNKK